MKELLIGLALLGSISAFADNRCVMDFTHYGADWYKNTKRTNKVKKALEEKGYSFAANAPLSVRVTKEGGIVDMAYLTVKYRGYKVVDEGEYYFESKIDVDAELEFDDEIVDAVHEIEDCDQLVKKLDDVDNLLKY